MNIIDIALLLIIGVSVIFAVYRGFLASLLGTAACLLSLALALMAGPKLAGALEQNQGVTDLLTTYTDAGSLIGDASLAQTPVIAISTDTLDNILKSVPLPAVVQDLLRQNIRENAFQSRGIYTVSQYLTTTIISVLLNVLSFLLCFFLFCLAFHILINLVGHVFYFPVLRHLDGLAAAFMGLVRGAVIVSVILILIPLVRTAIPFDLVQDYIDGSKLYPVLYNEKLLLQVIGGG